MAVLGKRKRIVLFLSVVIFLTAGCASYKYERVEEPYKGYVVKRNEYLIPEYTVDTKNLAPQDLSLAQNRFKRRQRIIDDYYKKMGRIENQFKNLVVNYPLFLVSLATAAIRLPFIVVSDYKYENNPKYREIIDKRDEANDKKDKEALDALKNSLAKYIEEDLKKEPPAQNSSQQKTN